MKKDIPGYEGRYQITEDGEVFSVARKEALPTRWGKVATRVRHGRRMKSAADKDGYLFVGLCKDGTSKRMRIARLVLTTFSRDPNIGEEACHVDHDVTNNHISNLVWGSRKDNEDQKTSSGRRPMRSKYSEEFVQQLQKLRLEGATLDAMAAKFGIIKSTLSSLISGQYLAKYGRRREKTVVI